MLNPLKSIALVNGGTNARFEWFAKIPNDTVLEDILKPGWLIHVAAKLKPFQRIELVTEDGMLDVDLRVLRIADGLVYTNPLRVTENKEARAYLAAARAKVASDATAAGEAELPPMPEGYKRGHSPANGYFVVMKATGKTIKTGLPTKIDAVQWATEHAKQAGLLDAA